MVSAVRIWLLVLLAVLLPVRGAAAAAMLCPMGSMSHPGGQSVPTASAAHQHDVHAAGEHHEQGSPADGCNLCAAFCSATPLLSEAPAVLASQALTALRFPAHAAAPPSFLSDGEERPPRST